MRVPVISPVVPARTQVPWPSMNASINPATPMRARNLRIVAFLGGMQVGAHHVDAFTLERSERRVSGPYETCGLVPKFCHDVVGKRVAAAAHGANRKRQSGDVQLMAQR